MSRIKNALTALSLLALAASAHAQRAALVSDADATIRSPYQETASTACPFAGVCVVTFSAVPAGRRREMQYVNCYIYTNNVSSSVEYVELNNSANSLLNPRIFVPVTTYPGTSWSYTAAATIMAIFDAGGTPQIRTFTSARQGLYTCTLVGREVAI